MANPFNPGVGRKPPYLAGRDDIARAIRSDMDRVYVTGEGSRPTIVSGLRGMGKTVFLRELAEYARERGWVVVWAEASNVDALSRKLVQAVYPELRRMRNSQTFLREAFGHAAAVLKSFQLKIDPSGTFAFGVDIDPARGYADSGDLALDFTDLLQALGEAAREAGTAVLIAIDELQEASKNDLSALNMALHAIGQGMSPVPVCFVGSGLPTLPATLADASSYAERMFRFYSLDLLDREAAKEAFVEPTERMGVKWDDSALGLALDAAAGYPYFIQQCGFCICEQLVVPGTVSLQEATDGIALAVAELDGGLYRSRWDRATAAGKKMLRAMSEDGTHSKMSDLAVRMRKETNALYPLRDRLIADGLIFCPKRGYVAFTVPGMGDFIKRHAE